MPKQVDDPKRVTMNIKVSEEFKDNLDEARKAVSILNTSAYMRDAIVRHTVSLLKQEIARRFKFDHEKGRWSDESLGIELAMGYTLEKALSIKDKEWDRLTKLATYFSLQLHEYRQEPPGATGEMFTEHGLFYYGRQADQLVIMDADGEIIGENDHADYQSMIDVAEFLERKRAEMREKNGPEG